MPLISGPCEGGPYHYRSIHHGLEVYRVAYERHRPRFTFPGSLHEPSEDLAVGAYVFHPMTEKWHWFADIRTAPLVSADYAVWITTEPVTSQIAPETSR